MYCRKCGRNIKDTNKFCTYCGCKVQNEKEIDTQITEKRR